VQDSDAVRALSNRELIAEITATVARLALATSIPGWMAALVVGGVLLAGGVVAGYIGWRHMVTNPLALTRQTVREDARWVKERLA
jgi:hypothetical protein